MPTRKPQSSGMPHEARRTSMRRLSSIASLQQLLSFSRGRRSNNATDNSTASCSSIPSLRSSTANTSDHLTAASSQTAADSILDVPPPTFSQTNFLLQSNYICLPDDPIGGMPRSRTFSNLPFSSRARREPQQLFAPAHRRRPSAFMGQSRLPTPTGSTRRYTPMAVPNAAPRNLHPRSRLKRSDTEPLLAAAKSDHRGHARRSTAFKENFTSSPMQSFTDADRWDEELFGSSYASNSSSIHQPWRNSNGVTSLPRQPSFSGMLPMSPSIGSTGSSYPGSRDRTVTPGSIRPRPLQRDASQPLLSNITNGRPGRHPEIKPTRLLSARHAPTPPPPRTPFSSQALESSRLKNICTFAHLRQASDSSPLARFQTPVPEPSAVKPTLGSVSTAESPAYWAGRLSALLDHYRQEDLTAVFSKQEVTVHRSDTDKLYAAATTSTRVRHALEHLHTICTTDTARESFVVFQLQYAASHNNPELSRPIKLDKPTSLLDRGGIKAARTGLQKSTEGLAVSTSSARRKLSFIDRLLHGGKSKRSSIA